MQRISETGSCAAWASDSKRLVYGHDGEGGIWITDLDGKDKRQLVPDGKDPSWSPDGTMIAYILGEEEEEVWLIQADGSGEPEHLVKGMYPHWMADSREVVYFSPEAKALCAIDCGSRKTRKVVSVDYEYSILSPDGKRVAYVPYGGLWMADVNDPERKVCLSPMQTKFLLTWSPDGQYIAYGGLLGSDLGIWVVPTEGSQELRRLHPLATKPAWSPDGKFIAYDDGVRGNSGIGVMNVEEALAKALTLQAVIGQLREKARTGKAERRDYFRLGEFLGWSKQYKEADEAFKKASRPPIDRPPFEQRIVESSGKEKQAEEKKTITVRVINEQQQPVSGALVKLAGLRPINSLGSWHGLRQQDQDETGFTTDSNGDAEVSYPAYVYERVETGAICLDVSHPDYATTSVSSYKTDGREESVIVSPGAELLAVALLNGVPVRDFVVHHGGAEFKSRTKEGTEGRIVQKIKEGNYAIYFFYTEPDGRKYYSSVEILEAKTGTSHRMELSLYPAISLKGALNSSVPRPIKNGQVKVDMMNETRMGVTGKGRIHRKDPATVHRVFDAEINADGSFSFEQLPRGYGEIIAICDGFVSSVDRGKPIYLQNQHFDLQTDGQEIVVEMEPTATFSGKVVDANAQPVAGAEVVLWPSVFWGNGYSQVFMQREYSATTDDKGEFSVVNLPGHGEESYTVKSEDYELAIEPVENQPVRRTRRAAPRPGEEAYQEIQVVPKGQTRIEAFRTD